MPSIASPRALWVASGFQPFIGLPNPQYLVGKNSTPFLVQGTLANASALALDLTLRGSWVTERRVAAAYSITSSGDTSRLNAVLSVAAVSVRLVNFSDANAGLWSNAQKLVTNATEPYLSGTIGGVPFRQSLKLGISHYIKRFESDQGTAADEITGTLDQGIAVLPQPVRVNLMTDALSFVSDAAPALGADVTATFCIHGTLVPADADAQWGSFYSGGACALQEQGIASAQELSSVRNMDLQYSNATARY